MDIQLENYWLWQEERGQIFPPTSRLVWFYVEATALQDPHQQKVLDSLQKALQLKDTECCISAEDDGRPYDIVIIFGEQTYRGTGTTLRTHSIKALADHPQLRIETWNTLEPLHPPK